MPPLDWARLATPEDLAEAEGWAGGVAVPDDAEIEGVCDGWAVGVADAWGVTGLTAVTGTRPVKSEPRIRSTVPGARLATRRSVTLVSSFLRVFTSAMSAADEYSMTDLV